MDIGYINFAVMDMDNGMFINTDGIKICKASSIISQMSDNKTETFE